MVAYRRAYMSLQGDERDLKRRLIGVSWRKFSRRGGHARGTRAAGDDGERGDRPSRPPGLTLTYEGPWP
jgi:hypothetical protein